MPKFTVYLLFCQFLFWNLPTKSQVLPINPSTGLVSINKVVNLEGRTLASLKETAELFISINSTPTAINYNPRKSKKKPKIWPFSATKYFDNDSTLVYDCLLNFLYKGPFESHIINFKINFYLKSGKFKYDISAFSHKNFGMKNSGMNGGQFESVEPIIGSKKKWKKFKVDVLESAMYPMAKAIEEFFNRQANSQTNF